MGQVHIWCATSSEETLGVPCYLFGRENMEEDRKVLPFPESKWEGQGKLKEKLIEIWDAGKKMGDTDILFIVGRRFGQNFANVSLFLHDLRGENWSGQQGLEKGIHLVCTDVRASNGSSGKWSQNYFAHIPHKRPVPYARDTNKKSLGIRIWR